MEIAACKTFRFAKRLLLVYGLLCVDRETVAQVSDATFRNFAYRCQMPDADCALFPASAELPTDGNLPIAQQGRFTPTCQQVIQVEKRLCSAGLLTVSSKKPDAYERKITEGIEQQLKKYHRQYFGFYDARHHACLYINFFHERVEEHPGFVPRWRREIIQVEDGGADYWSIYYDLDSRKFYKFRHNPEG